MAYDYLVVGAGLYGATFARLATDAGRRCLVIDKREHIAGNCFDERQEGILVNRYGGHIFHTNDARIWQFVNRFAEFSNYRHRVKARYGSKVYDIPINLHTLNEIYSHAVTPGDGERFLDVLGDKTATGDDFEHYCLRTFGRDIYEILFRGYTKKQWGRDPSELPASIAKRIPIRLTYDDRYFDDKFQGMPVEGYTTLVDRLLFGIEVKLGEDFLGHTVRGERVVYSGPLDVLFGNRFGPLDYRSLRFEHEVRDGDFQGCATMNYTDEQIPYTRIIEWKHFRPEQYQRTPQTVITREYPASEGEPYYPINDEANAAVYKQYREIVPDWLVVGGRLGSYRYLNMDQAIGMAMSHARKEGLCG